MTYQKIIIASTDIGTGGLGSYIVTLAMGLKASGWDVHLLTTNARGNYVDGLGENFSCHDLSSVPLSPQKIFMAADLINSILPTIIVMNNCALLQYALPLLDPTIKPIAVLHSNDDRFYAIASIFSQRVFRWIAPTSGLVEPMKKMLSSELHTRIRVIHHGVSGKVFFPDDNRRRTDRFQIVFVGFLGESKGADLLPQIFQRVQKAIPNTFLTIVGDGPLRDTIKSEFDRNGLSHHVMMRGTISPDQTAEIMRASHVLLLPTNLEGFGMVIIESMMCGVVPVVTRLEGITDELVKADSTGFLVSPKQTSDFGDIIVALGRNRSLLSTISMNCQKVAATNFSAQTMVTQYENLFSEADDRYSKSKYYISRWFIELVYQVIKKRFR